MLGELQDVIESPEFDDCGWLHITGVGTVAPHLRVNLEVRFDDVDYPTQRWQLLCGDARAYRVLDEPADTMAVYDQHPLLYRYTAPQVSLSFLGTPSNAAAVVGDLWAAHVEVSEGWIDFAEFLNEHRPLADLLAGGYGTVAEGPRPILEAYAKVLGTHALGWSVYGEHTPRRWRSGGWEPEAPDLQAWVCGASFIIGRTFSVQRESQAA